MTTATRWYERHRELLDQAVAATTARGGFPAFPAPPGDAAAVQPRPGGDFPVEVPGAVGTVATERSPYGIELDLRYPRADPAALVAAARATVPAWRTTGPHGRAGFAAEILRRLHERSAALAHAVWLTTGQPAGMAAQAGVAQAVDRGLEATALALAATTRVPGSVVRDGPRGARIEQTSTVVGRGVALVIGCCTFPTWNAYPGLFASLVTGNPVIVKPHPRAVLPLAMTVATAREVLAEAGLPPDVVTLAAEDPADRIAAALAVHPDVRVVDYTGSAEFGTWIEANARQAVVHAEKSGLNPVLLDSTADYRGLLRNLALSLTLYSGQMCTTPQNLLIAEAGIATDQGRRTPDEFAADLSAAVGPLLTDPGRVLGAIVDERVLARIAEAAALPGVVRGPAAPADERWPGAILRTPVLVRLGHADDDVYTREWFGPVSFVITTRSTGHGLQILTDTVRRHGALTALVHSTDPAVLAATREAALDAGVHLAENLTGGVLVNETAAFSDLHGTGANPAATVSLADDHFVTGRFVTLQSRRPAQP